MWEGASKSKKINTFLFCFFFQNLTFKQQYGFFFLNKSISFHHI